MICTECDGQGYNYDDNQCLRCLGTGRVVPVVGGGPVKCWNCDATIPCVAIDGLHLCPDCSPPAAVIERCTDCGGRSVNLVKVGAEWLCRPCLSHMLDTPDGALRAFRLYDS